MNFITQTTIEQAESLKTLLTEGRWDLGDAPFNPQVRMERSKEMARLARAILDVADLEIENIHFETDDIIQPVQCEVNAFANWHVSSHISKMKNNKIALDLITPDADAFEKAKVFFTQNGIETAEREEGSLALNIVELCAEVQISLIKANPKVDYRRMGEGAEILKTIEVDNDDKH